MDFRPFRGAASWFKLPLMDIGLGVVAVAGCAALILVAVAAGELAARVFLQASETGTGRRK